MGFPSVVFFYFYFFWSCLLSLLGFFFGGFEISIEVKVIDSGVFIIHYNFLANA